MLYFKKNNDLRVVFSDKHYRGEAIEALQAMCNTLRSKLGTRTNYPVVDSCATEIPIILIREDDFETRILLFELGVRVDQDGSKYSAALLEQGINKPVDKSHHNSLAQYVKDACRTECEYTDGLKSRVIAKIDLLHGAIGLCTEVGELQDQVKRHMFYGKPLDVVNIEEELGDIMWFCAIICKSLDLSLDVILQKNIAKLRARYPEKFTEEKADMANRNLKEERKVLERERCWKTGSM